MSNEDLTEVYIPEKTLPDLTIFVPTRGRPAVVPDFASTFFDHCTGKTRLIFVVDEDDPERSRYVAKNAGRWEIWVAPQTVRGMVGALNAAYSHFEAEGDLGFAVGFLGDDHRPRTVGWDTQYLEALRELGSGFVYGDDLFQHEHIPTQVAFTTDIAKALGYMSPPELHHLFVDVVWRDLGKYLGMIKYLPDVIVEHMHPLAGKAKNDKNYRVVNSNLMARHDNVAWHAYMEDAQPNGLTRFDEDLARIRMMLENGYAEPR